MEGIALKEGSAMEGIALKEGSAMEGIAFKEGSAMEGIALKALMIMSHLILQTLSAKSKSKDHANHLERRLHAWKEGHLEELNHEARVLQSHRQYNITHRSQDSRTLVSTFSKLMLPGKTRAALRLLEKKGKVKFSHWIRFWMVTAMIPLPSSMY